MPSDHECGHVEGGSMATTTNKLEFLHNYVEYPKSYSKSHWPRLAVADKFPHFPSGEGYLKACSHRGWLWLSHVQVFLHPDSSCYHHLP